MAEDESMVNRVAKAIYGEHVKQARTELEGVSFEHADLVDLVIKLRTESETAQILIFYSYLDDRILGLLARQMVSLDTSAAKEGVFGSNGPLGSFSNRIRLAYHLDWLSRESWSRLDAFRRIRNEFAHRAFKISIDDPAIVDKLKIIDYGLQKMFENIVPAEHHASLNAVLPRLVMLSHRTFVELLVRPIAKAHHVHPEHIMMNYGEQPENMKELGRSVAKATLIAAGVPIEG